MKAIPVTKMAKYYVAADLIGNLDFGLKSASETLDIRAYSNLNDFIKNVLIWEDANLYFKVCDVFKEHSKNPRIKRPFDQTKATISEEYLIKIEEDVSKWGYYDDKQFEIDKWMKYRRAFFP